MDPERQTLLGPDDSNLRYRSIRPLSYDEVCGFQNSARWHRTRLTIVFMFWALIATMISVIACMVMKSRCDSVDYRMAPSVAPVHMTLASLAWRVGDDTPFS